MDKKQKKTDAHNQRVRTKVLNIIESQYKSPNDIVVSCRSESPITGFSVLKTFIAIVGVV